MFWKKGLKSAKNDGFTLTEVLVVVAIIGVVLALAIPVAKGSFEKARVNQSQVDIAAVEAALEGFKTKYGYYPDASPASRIPVTALSEFMTFPSERVISNEFYDPWNNPYRYSEPGTNNTSFADISSAGPDRLINDGNWMTSNSGNNADNVDNWSQKR
jgi:general secretion pathway protein G